MKKFIIFILPVLALFLFLFWPEKTITYPPGITAANQPNQNNLSGEMTWTKGDFQFKAIAEFEIKARVLSRNNFSVGRESKISPVDFALGWGSMSDQSVIDKIRVTQSNRWYRWETDSFPIPREEIIRSSSNIHIIPADDIVEGKLDNVYKGSLIEMKGYLVEINTSDGWHWKSSLRRDDTGGGACELFWVEALKILDPPNK